ncbi:MAG: hypothetical protein MHPSP_003205, partial [Paramarteilia canceri]
MIAEKAIEYANEEEYKEILSVVKDVNYQYPVDELYYDAIDFRLDFIEMKLLAFAKEQCENFNNEYLSKIDAMDSSTALKTYYEKFTEYDKNAIKVSCIFLEYNSWKTFLEKDKRYIIGTNKDVVYSDSNIEKLSPVQQ